MALTGPGRSALAAGAVLIVVGTYFDYPEVLALGLAAATAVTAGLLRALPRIGITVERFVHPDRVEEGEKIRCDVRCANSGRWRVPELELTEVIDGVRTHVSLPRLRAGAGEQVRTYWITPPRRGVYELPPPSVARYDGLRLAARRSWSGRPQTVYVRPRVYPLAATDAYGSRELDGWTANPHLGQTSFHSLREYVDGDDPRLIHWPSSARLGSLVVRQAFVPSTMRFTIVLDTAMTRYTSESFEDAVRIAASLAVAVTRTGAPLTLCTTDSARAAPPPSDGPDGDPEGTVLDFLAGVRLTPAARGAARWHDALATVDEVATLTVVTGNAYDDELSAVLNAAAVTSVQFVRVGVPEAERSTAPRDGRLLDVGTAFDFSERWIGWVRP
ncbi:DUF58 domain-containing protein [Phytohabitans aurantiacus]|uniref:DUF58 domain-containing protein n=1 Tax=Phytohabitans aurantiacus TaxID=3016789 RepID=UPI00249329B4|nr:DUF58 domain-containing protein [Phytohabitans aurantiacus]